MPNSDLIGKNFEVKNENLKKYLGNNISYENMKRKKSELENDKIKNINNYNKNGGDNVLKWIDNTLKTERDTIHNEKNTRMNAGEENQFKKEHTKDRDNTNITKIGLPNLHKGSTNKNIMSNKVTYNEELQKEINSIKYLIEYMNNNKTKI